MPAEYDRVADAIAAKVRGRSSGYEPGERIPTVEVLAAEYDVSEATVKVALGILRREGYLRDARGGRGNLVVDNPPSTPEPPPPVDE